MVDLAGALTRLGIGAAERAVVLHADDVGMCGATVAAYRDIVAKGIVTSGSLMAPCSWFPAIASFCAEHRGSVDMGVHLTLTSEWSCYRWGPITGPDPLLCDEAGYFHRYSVQVQNGVEPRRAIVELGAQVERARRAGVDVTHIDSHMCVVEHARLISEYLSLALELELPCFVVPEALARLRGSLAKPELAALSPFSSSIELPLARLGNRLELAKRCLDGTPAGLCYFMCHPALDTPELRAIAPDWEARVADYRLCMDDGLQRVIEVLGFRVVSMRALREALFG